jgi:GntR family transcriptional regulator/MocR family aminotransferase
MYLQEKPFSSFHVLALFYEEVTVGEETQVIENLKSLNISAFSLSKCYIGEPLQKGIILGYGSVRPSVIKKKIKTMEGMI